MKKVLLSGVKPTGRPHLGNYFGAMKQFVDFQDKHETNIFLADFHAITSVQNAAELKQNSIDMILDYLAIGLDPKKITLFKQSDVPEVTELAWIFNCITTMPYLMRAHAFKDAEAKDKEINVGVFDYPILMAADILLPGAQVVPVGKDQKQHVEYARDIAEKFNRIFGETFILPEAMILEDVATVPGIDGQKMSKSYNNTIPLFASDEEIRAAVMKIPTDSAGVEDPKDPDQSIIYQIHSLILDDSAKTQLRSQFEKGGLSYKDAKENLVKDLIEFISPMRERRAKYAKNLKKVLREIEKGGKRMRKKIQPKMNEVRMKVGLDINN
jgi:tryptophanyl-tRNA synthetase